MAMIHIINLINVIAHCQIIVIDYLQLQDSEDNDLGSHLYLFVRLINVLAMLSEILNMYLEADIHEEFQAHEMIRLLLGYR